MNEGELLWEPDDWWLENANITAFERWLKREYGLEFTDYEAMWRWSVENLDDFWAAAWRYFDIKASSPYTSVLGSREMPGADWFPGASLNYAEHILRHEAPGEDALVSVSEIREMRAMSWDELAGAVRIVATRLRELGLGTGDMVAAYMPNIPETAIAMLATTSIGAIWASCSPDFGTRNIEDRLKQLEPRVLFCVDGYRYKGEDFDRRPELKQILSALPTVKTVIYLPYLDPDDPGLPVASAIRWQELLDHPPVAADEFQFEQVPFSHPLWVLFSSGTTGLPKGIVQSHGGTILEQLKLNTFHMDMKPGERMFYFTTTGWMIWNSLISSMLVRAVPVLYDGNPVYPDSYKLWEIADQSDLTFFGISPTYVQMLEKQAVVPGDRYELKSLHSIVMAGSPATPDNMAWFHTSVKAGLWVAIGSGGTDICSGFIGGMPTIPVYAGEMQSRHLGVDVHAFNDEGEAVRDEVGEMVVCQPMPSMPIYLWNDPDFSRYNESYFEMFPGKWRQGDFFKVNQRGGCFVLGRSDATLNRFGVRIGTAEVYRCVASLDEVEDSLIVNLDLPGGNFFMPLFVKMVEGAVLDDRVREEICQRLKTEYSPRHVPDEIFQVDDLPYTLTGKKMEVPVRRILMGMPLNKAANPGVMANAAVMDYFIDFARERAASLSSGAEQ